MQFAFATQRAGARVRPVFARRIQHRCQSFVQHIQNLRNPQLAGFGYCGRKIFPEPVQHVFVIALAGGDVVQFLFQIGSEFIADIFAKEIQQEDCDHAPLVLGEQAVFFLADIFAVLNRGDDRRIG